jgi:hypothetical protein
MADVNADGKADLCILIGVNGGTTGTGALEIHCADAATNYSTRVLEVGTAYGYINTQSVKVLSPSMEQQAVPTAPLNVSALAATGSASITFASPVFDGRWPVTSYTVTATDQTNTANGAQTAAGSSSPISVPGLMNGDSYTFTVTATNALGTSVASAVSNTVVPYAGVPTSPGRASAVPGNGAATVHWSPPSSDGGSPLTGYVVTPYVGSIAQTALAKSFAPGVLSATMSGLVNGTTYAFRVAAQNLVGPGPATISAPITVGAPLAPVVTAVGSSSQAVASWTAPANNGSTVTSYVVRTYLGGVLQSAKTHTLTCAQPCSPTRSWTVTGLTNGSLYTFKVVAVNARGTGPAGATTIKVGVPVLPGAPTSVQATAGAGSATVSWAAPANGSATITAYVITPTRRGSHKPRSRLRER